MTSKKKEEGRVATSESGQTAGSSLDDPLLRSSPRSSQEVLVLMVAGWLIPGAGHLLQRRWVRGVCFFGLVCFSVTLGAYLDGKLFSLESGQPLATLGTLASVGAGIPYLVLRWLMDYEGDIRSATFEYGGAFLLTAGLMNIMALLDVWDVARGNKP